MSKGMLAATIVLVIAWIFLAPVIVAHAWALFAVGMFGAPAISYGTAFWVTWAIHILFGGTSALTNSKKG